MGLHTVYIVLPAKLVYLTTYCNCKRQF